MSGREQISNYLKSFSRYLASLSSEDAAEVIQEIESHIYDVIDQQEMAGKKKPILKASCLGLVRLEYLPKIT